MQNLGWIKLHRKLLDNSIFYKPDYLQLWLFVLLRVNHEENKFIWNNQQQVVKQGSGIFSQKQMAVLLKMPISKVNRILKFLQNENQIVITTCNKYTIIEVVNWVKFQEHEENGNQTETKEKPNGNQIETKQKSNRNQIETNKNDKNDKNEKNEKNEKEAESELVYPFLSNDFKKIWQVWNDYRTQRNISYKNLISEQAALKQLAQLAAGSEAAAIAIVEQSLANQWQGLFELKTVNHHAANSGTTKNTGNARLNSERIDEFFDAFVAGKR